VEWEGHQGTDLPLQEPVEQHQCSGHHLQTEQEGQHLGTEMNRWMEGPNLIRRTNLTLQLHQSKEWSNPRLTNRNRNKPGNDSGQPTLDQSRPPTPNWMGFALPPNFQEARENDRRAHEAGEESSHPTYARLWNRTNVVAMEPLSIDHNLYLDYRSPQSIKFFNKGRERLPGDLFSGKNIFSWLKRLEIKANEFHWIPTLTIMENS
jgi:hypothetical protein